MGCNNSPECCPGPGIKMLYSDALSYLSRYTNYERELRYPYDGWAMNLERVRVLLKELGDPLQGLPVVHVAGSKGKGSTAAMIESVMRAAGYKTGLFTSPHLIDFRERIRICGKMADEQAVSDWVERLVPAARKVHQNPKLGPLTYFEILTAMAICIFSEAGVDLAILEAGLGGRYDATTVCDPIASVLTPISLDHTDILGDTIAAIALEKSMIIKPGRPAVIAPQEEAAAEVFSERCEDVRAPELKVQKYYSWNRVKEEVTGQWVDIKGAREFKNFFIPLPGDHQCLNAATALTLIDRICEGGFTVEDGDIRDGFLSLSWPARFERVRERPDVILDGAHNAASAARLGETVSRLYPGRRIIVVMGLGGDKDVEGFCSGLGPVADDVFITRSQAIKAVEPERIKKALGAFSVRIREADSAALAMDMAMELSGPEDVVVVTGSFYVIAEAMEWGKGKADWG